MNEAAHLLMHRVQTGQPRFEPLHLLTAVEVFFKRLGRRSSSAHELPRPAAGVQRTHATPLASRFGSRLTPPTFGKYFCPPEIRQQKPPGAKYCVSCVKAALRSKVMSSPTVMPPESCWFANDEALVSHLAICTNKSKKGG
jgi:hypothetical protein